MGQVSKQSDLKSPSFQQLHYVAFLHILVSLPYTEMELLPILDFMTVSDDLLISTPWPHPASYKSIIHLLHCLVVAEPLPERSIHFHPIDVRLDQGMWFGQQNMSRRDIKSLKAALRGTMHSCWLSCSFLSATRTAYPKQRLLLQPGSRKEKTCGAEPRPPNPQLLTCKQE